MDFYPHLLSNLVAQGRLDPAARTLVVAGDAVDRDALRTAGFTGATISNLDGDAASLAPYGWAWLDAEALDLADGSHAAFAAARFPVALVARLLPRQANVLAFLIDKSARTLHPWKEPDGRRMVEEPA